MEEEVAIQKITMGNMLMTRQKGFNVQDKNLPPSNEHCAQHSFKFAFTRY